MSTPCRAITICLVMTATLLKIVQQARQLSRLQAALEEAQGQAASAIAAAAAAAAAEEECAEASPICDCHQAAAAHVIPPPTPPAPPTSGQHCQTRCDRECSRYDDCDGEAWVCINLYELLRSDSGPVPAGPPFDQCFEEVAHEGTRSCLKAMARKHLSNRRQVDKARSLSFQKRAERCLHDSGMSSVAAGASAPPATRGGRRRVPHDLLLRAARKKWTPAQLVTKVTSAECQPRGVSLPRLARERSFNRSHWTFGTRNLHQDALLFLLDLYSNFGTAIDSASWLGVGFEQDPYDAMAIQSIITRIRPGLIIETGTFNGGSALFYASILRLVNPSGKVHTVDPWSRRHKHSRQSWSETAVEIFDSMVTYHPQSSLDRGVSRAISAAANASTGPVMVILDSSHRGNFVSKELARYGPMVSVGSYLIVEDTKLDRYLEGFEEEPGVAEYWKSFRWHGPTSAVKEFVKAHPSFVVDRSAEPRILYSQHVSGYLRRVS